MKVEEKKDIFKFLKNVSQKLRVLHLCCAKMQSFFLFLSTRMKKGHFALKKALDLSSILRKLLDKLPYVLYFYPPKH